MGISCGWLKSLGFTEHDPPKEITGTCYIVRIYQINGIMKFDNDEQMINSFNKNTEFGIGNNINELCVSLFENEIEEIEKQVEGSCPPYLVTVTTDKEMHKNKCKWTQLHNETLFTYDCFQQEEGNVIELINTHEMPYIPIICCAFSSCDKPVTGKLLHQCIFWKMPDGKCFMDYLMRFSGEGETLKKIVLFERKKEVIALIKKSHLLNSTTSKLLFRSMQEDDKIIKFLFSWTTLEILIDEKFSDNKEKPSEFPPDDKIPVEYKKIVSQLYNDPTKERKFNTVGQKFVYLSIYDWNFSSNIYDKFQAVKKIRNDFIHHNRDVSEHELVTPSINILNIINEIINADFVGSNDSCETTP